MHTDTAPERTPLSSWMALGLLLLLGLYTIIDRPLLSLQAQTLRTDLGLTDFQLGLVQGFGVAIVTAVAGYPLGWLADRYDRRRILAVSIAFWGLAMAGAGLATSFESLFIASALIGAGEACLVPITFAFMPELFANKHRHLANSLAVLCGRLGTGFMIAVCGWMIAGIDSLRAWLPDALAALPSWRLVLLAGALPAAVLAPLILLLPAPVRHTAAAHATQAGASHSPMAPVAPFLKQHPVAFVSLYFGLATIVFAINCVFAFAPVVSMRYMGGTPLSVGNLMGLSMTLGTIAGFVIAQIAPRWLTSRFGTSTPALLLFCTPVFSTIGAAGLLWAEDMTMLFTSMGVMLTAVMAGTLLFPSMIQDMSPAPLRVRLAAISITLNIVGGSLGGPAVGAISDLIGTHPRALQLAMGGTATAALVVGAIILLPLVRRYAAAVESAQQPIAPTAPTPSGSGLAA